MESVEASSEAIDLRGGLIFRRLLPAGNMGSSVSFEDELKVEVVDTVRESEMEKWIRETMKK